MINRFANKALRGKSKSTIKTYVYVIKQFEEWLRGSDTDLSNYGRVDVQQYMDYLQVHKKSASTINKVFTVIKRFSQWAGKKETVEDIVIIKAPDIKKRAPVALSNSEKNKLLRDVDRSGNNRNNAIVVVLLMTGVRVSELVNLDRSDIRIGERKGSVRVLGKGNKERVIPLNMETRRAIGKYLQERTDPNPALFLSNRGRRINTRSVQHILNKYGFYPHQLRHTFITNLVRNKEDISIIQSLSGHADVDMILRYSQPSEEDREGAVDRLI